MNSTQIYVLSDGMEYTFESYRLANPELTETQVREQLIREVKEIRTLEESGHSQPHRGPLTLREMQSQLPWTVRYHRDFRASPVQHKDFAHALLHVQKATGKLASVINDAEHGGSQFKPEDIDRFVADLVVCALRMATTCPGRNIDLQHAVEDRIQSKNQAELHGTPQ